ncbi:MAG: beta-ACP synthase [Prevotellaceae bacterium]|nr:beta-ACP synthase [Prevotellaceae bacterium]
MEHNRVVYAVSDNIISSLGFTTGENIAHILEAKTGIAPVTNKTLYPEPFLASLIDREKASALLTTNFSGNLDGFHPLEQLMLLSSVDALKRCAVDPASPQTVFIFSTTKGNIDLLTAGNELNQDVELWEMAKRIAVFWGSPTDPLVISNACISGVLAVVLAERLIKSGKYDHAVLIGGDLSTEFAVSGFQSFKSVSPNPCKPFDKDRDGLSMGEGIATLVLSSDKKTVTDSIPVMVAGGSSSNDANHISGPSRTGDGLFYAIRDALEAAGIPASVLDLINPHGTATPFNDEMESKAIGLASLSGCPLMALKGYIGHTLGAAGLIESIICLESIRRQTIFQTKGFTETGVPVPVNVTTEIKKGDIRNVLKTASGFGGCNAAVIFSSETAGISYKQTPKIRISKECLIENRQVIINGSVAFDGAQYGDFASFIRAAFKSVSDPYMKFSKMDDLCKLGLTAAEFLLQGTDITEKYERREIAMLLENRYSSLDTDITHQRIINIKDPYQPSPAVFVYTLANIVMGEICIRHKFQGENLFLISAKKDEKQLMEQVELLFSSSKTKACIAGWADYLNGKYDAKLFLVEKI